VQFRSKVPTWNQLLGTWHGRARAGLRYLLKGCGPLSTGTTLAGGFLPSSPQRSEPNIQLYVTALTRDKDPGKPGRMAKADTYPAFGMSVSNVRPRSRGWVSLSSSDPRRPPSICCNFLQDGADLDEMIEGVHLIRSFAETPSMKRVIEREYMPGSTASSDADIAEDIRARAYSIYHPCGTCRTGKDAGEGVVNSRLQVHGLQGLRIADASVLPFVLSGNLNGPSMMIGQRASEIILEDLEKPH
jgi:choline dehydrogenase